VIVAEMDEQWSYVQSKQQQRWLWYALDKPTSKVVAYTFGTRADSTLKSLLEKLMSFKIILYFTDGWGSYERLLDQQKHIVGKRYTQKIERCNLNFRTRVKRLARKTICFSKSSEIHDKVIGTLIETIAF
jgi:insertion element IS1 protein InsB